MNTDDRALPVRGAEDILGIAADWCAAGETVAIATVIQSWGSSPRPAGSRMALTKTGKMEGSVSGGCIEGAVADAALEVMDTGTAQVLTYGVTDESAWAVGLACGGQVSVLVEKLT
jgi:xanthine dehydrogenase accessory factor